MKLLVIDNLASGIDDGSIFDFVRSFVRDGDEVCIRSTDGTTDMRMFLYDAEEFDAVIASGGDGTISTIAYALANTGIPVLPYPSGTANLLTMNLLQPSEPHAIMKMMRDFKTMDFDIGEMEFSEGETRGFMIMAGAGYDATIMKAAERGKKSLGSVAYFTSAFANPTPQFSDITVTVDGEEHRTSGVGVLLINFSKIQFDISLLHENEPRDGLFDVVVLNTKDAWGLIPAFFAAILDRGGDFPSRPENFEIFRGREVAVSADPPMYIQFDGEAVEHQTPFKARTFPRGARFVISDECEKAYS